MHKNEGRMMCLQCITEDVLQMNIDGKQGDKSLDPIMGGKGRYACIYHGELTESQMKFVAYPDEASRIRDLNHSDKVLKKLGLGKYAGQEKPVSSQSEILSRMKELKESSNSAYEFKYIDLRSEEERRIEENAYRESKLDLGEENEQLVNELMSLLSAARIGFEDNPNFDEEGFEDIRNKIHKIGQHLHDKGGRKLMLILHSRIADLGENARLVEQIWWEGYDSIE